MSGIEVEIPVDGVTVEGDLIVPDDAKGLVLFAHGSGSSRFSPRNRYVARQLREAGLATLLMDLLTREEEAVDVRTRHLRFDIDLLADRLAAATDWVLRTPDLAHLPRGYFGSSTGAAAALVAAEEHAEDVQAVVSRGGRPDLADRVLGDVHAPTLLIVGGNDAPVIELNRTALRRLRVDARMVIVPGATHLFEEPGKLEQVAHLARDWFLTHLAGARPGSPTWDSGEYVVETQHA